MSMKRLVDVTLKIGSGATPRGGSDAYHEEGISLVRSLNVHDDGFRMKDLAFLDDEQAERLSNVELSSGDVLLNITGASIARCCVLPEQLLPARVNQHVSIVRPNPSILDPFYLHYQLISPLLKEALLNMARAGGSTREALTKAQIQAFQIAVPPLPEQHRIVGKLDAAFAALGEAQGLVERNRANARELFESYLNGVFERKGDGWETEKLGDMCSTITKGTTPTTHGYAYQPEGVNFIKVESVSTDHEFLPDMFAHVSDECHAFLKRSQLQENDILFSIAGALGRVAMVKGEHLPANTNQALAIFRLVEDAPVRHDYLLWLLSSDLVVQQTAGMAGGAAQQNLSLTQMKDLDIAFPSKAVQKKLIEAIERIAVETEQLESTYAQKLLELDALKKGLLGAAFRGEL